MSSNRFELFLQTCDLIAKDRCGTARDDGYHRLMRARFETATRDFTTTLERMNRALLELSSGFMLWGNDGMSEFADRRLHESDPIVSGKQHVPDNAFERHLDTVLPRPTRALTAAAEADRDDFIAAYDRGNCSCHISAPCGSCMHPGNPENQEEDESCWEDAPSYSDGAKA